MRMLNPPIFGFRKCTPMFGITGVITMYPAALARPRFVAYFAVASRAAASCPVSELPEPLPIAIRVSAVGWAMPGADT